MKKHWTELIIPLVLIVGSFILIACGIDGEVKTILCLAAGWAFKTGYDIRKEAK